MTDQPATFYNIRVTLDITIPEGVSEWRFTATADGQNVAVSQPVAVRAEKEPSSSDPSVSGDARDFSIS
jgi:hypothetical protein